MVASYTAQRRRLIALIAALLVDAVFGFALTTLIDFDPSKHSAMQTTVLVFHLLIAVGIIVGGILQVASAVRAATLRAPVLIGFLGSVAAFVTGGISADSGNDRAVFLMATCFLVALTAYGYTLARLQTARVNTK